MQTLMVIDDNKVDLESVRSIVELYPTVEWLGGYADAQAALAALGVRLPDMVIIAVELAEMNGLMVARTIKETLPQVQVIMAAHSRNFANEAYDVGARGYLIKPLNPNQVLTLLEKVSEFGGGSRT
ncbi:response regulator [Paenibacillus sp. TRM 82003]|nr:response regulator [Paenibacillus sp. TRM 82003]